MKYFVTILMALFLAAGNNLALGQEKQEKELTLLIFSGKIVGADFGSFSSPYLNIEKNSQQVNVLNGIGMTENTAFFFEEVTLDRRVLERGFNCKGEALILIYCQYPDVPDKKGNNLMAVKVQIDRLEKITRFPGPIKTSITRE